VKAASLKTMGLVKLFPEGRPSHHVASMQLGSSTDVSIAPLSEFLISRATNRRMGQPAHMDQAAIDSLVRGVEREGALLRVVTDRQKIDDGADILAASDRLRFLLPQVHREMLSEIKWPGRDSLEEGLDVRTLELDPGGYAVMDLIARSDVMENLADWRAGQALGMRMRASILTSSALAIVTVPRADPMWYVRGGAAMERFWLMCEQMGLAVQPASPVFLYAVDEGDLRELSGERYLDEMHQLSVRFNDFWSLGDGETAIMVFRLFQAPPPSVHSIRLPMAHVLSSEKAGPEVVPTPPVQYLNGNT
jgi:hypothetical protein